MPAGMPRFLRGAGIQAKLEVNQPGDPYEQQADRVADAAASGEHGTQSHKGAPASNPSVSPIPVSDSGRPLTSGVRQRAESAVGGDLGQVRVHDGPADRDLARGIQARAFTHGDHIWLGPQQSSEDVKLMAHESAHVVQQGAAPGQTPVIQRSLAPSPPEQENPVSPEQPEEQPSVPPAPKPAPGPAPIPKPETCPPPKDLACPQGTTSPGAVTNTLIFPQDSALLSRSQRAEVDAAAASWHAAGGTAIVRVDAYASAEGACNYNWDLSCRRAEAVVAELEAPSDGSAGVPSSNIEFFAHGETDEFARSLAPNRQVTISIPSAPPAPEPEPAPPCSFPVILGTGRTGCGSGTDFTHFDFPGISFKSAAKLEAWALTHPGSYSRSDVTDWECEVEMDAVLSGLAGGAGHAAFARFAAGTGGTEVLGGTSTLGAMALASGSFKATLAAVKANIEAQLAAQAAAGALDPCALSVIPPATHFDYSDGLDIKAVIGGTHGESLSATGFTGSIPLRSYGIDLLFDICDNFGVDEDDLYAPGLMAFWVLQHERSASLYAPFINLLDLPVTISGTF
jgi:outer membrane protein OmpA-like peptidoglycan-associated protein